MTQIGSFSSKYTDVICDVTSCHHVPMVMVILSYFSRYGAWRTEEANSHVTTILFLD